MPPEITKDASIPPRSAGPEERREMQHTPGGRGSAFRAAAVENPRSKRQTAPRHESQKQTFPSTTLLGVRSDGCVHFHTLAQAKHETEHRQQLCKRRFPRTCAPTVANAACGFAGFVGGDESVSVTLSLQREPFPARRPAHRTVSASVVDHGTCVAQPTTACCCLPPRKTATQIARRSDRSFSRFFCEK